MKTIQPSISIFGAIEKVARQSGGTLLVSAVVSSESIDDQGEVVTYDALKKAAPGYMEWAPVNEMHTASAVGTTVELALDDAGRRGLATLHVVDPLAVQKVEAGVYKGVSIEGSKNTWEMAKAGGRNVRRVTDITWKRLSLVDRPSNPDAVLTLAKRSAEAQMDTEQPEAVESSEDTKLEKAAPTDAEREEMPDADFVFPDEKAFPVTDQAGIADAVASWGRYKGAHDFEEFKDALTALAKKHGWEDGLPEKWDEPAKEETAKMSESGDLAKSAVDDTAGAGMALNVVNLLIENESKEPTVEPDQIAALKEAQAALLKFMGQEAAEIGAPEGVAEAATEDAAAADAVEEMAYASKPGDLAKIGKRNASADEAKIKQAIAILQALLGDETSEPAEKGSAITAGLVFSGDTLTPETLAKMTDAFSRMADLPRKEDLDAVQAAMLEGLTPLKEQVAQMAKMAAPGGPVRYAERDGRLVGAGEASAQEGDEIAILQKMSNATQSPALKAALGERLALLQLQNVPLNKR